MDRSISLKAAIDALESIGSIDTEADKEYARSVFEALPSTQPIIQCGTCKWFQCNMRPDGYLPKGVEEFECRHWGGPCDPLDFCSYAERKDDVTGENGIVKNCNMEFCPSCGADMRGGEDG